MVSPFSDAGNLPPGIHRVSWEEFVERFGATPHRLKLVEGLRRALQSLLRAGCRTVYIDGSFVTAKEAPGDFDACWDPLGVNGEQLDPVLLDFSNRRAAQKAKFGGELFPSSALADQVGNTFLEFFQVDKATGEAKGIIALDLQKVSL